MKTKTKALVLALCAVALVVCTVFATMAFLTSTTETVKNTFTFGKVKITLDEADVDEYGVEIEPEDPEETVERVTANKYKLIPGHTYTKDPTIHVDKDSEDCWVFAKVENGLGDDATINISTSDWALVDGTTDTYAYKEIVSAKDDIAVFTQFIFGSDADPADYENASIDITAYAVQADGFTTAAAAWTAAFGASSSSGN